MNRNYVVILQAVRLDTVKDRVELAEFDRPGNAKIFLAGKAMNMWSLNCRFKKAKSPSIGDVVYFDTDEYRMELFIQPRLVTIKEFGKANAPQT